MTRLHAPRPVGLVCSPVDAPSPAVETKNLCPHYLTSKAETFLHVSGVACSGSTVVVVDGNGAVLVPTALLEDVVRAAVKQELQARWIMGEVELTAALPQNGASSGPFSAAQRARRTAARDHLHRLEQHLAAAFVVARVDKVDRDPMRGRV